MAKTDPRLGATLNVHEKLDRNEQARETHVDLEELKKSGYIFQSDGEHFTVRLRIPGGDLSSEQMISIGKIAEKWGRGEVHLTTRQGVEIPWVKYEELVEITKTLDEIGTPPGSCGPRIRNISSCVGMPRCPHANVNSQELAKEIDERFFDVVLPRKLKIAVSGCPNACAKPQINDIGVMGVVKPRIISEICDGCGDCVRKCREAAIRIINGVAEIDFSRCVYCGECIKACPINADVVDREGYTIFIGGNVGRHPRFAYKIVDFADHDAVFRLIENNIKFFEEEGKRGERFGHLIERLGLGESLRRLLP